MRIATGTGETSSFPCLARFRRCSAFSCAGYVQPSDVRLFRLRPLPSTGVRVLHRVVTVYLYPVDRCIWKTLHICRQRSRLLLFTGRRRRGSSLHCELNDVRASSASLRPSSRPQPGSIVCRHISRDGVLAGIVLLAIARVSSIFRTCTLVRA